MKYKTLFRMMLKVVGVWLSISGAVSILSWASTVLFVTFQRPAGMNWSSSVNLFAIIGAIAQIAAGAYLFFDGKWVADRAIPSNRPYCHECGYELTGATSDNCPECGTPFRSPAVATRA